MQMEQLLEAMETIVASGTKLNLNYAIDQLVDEDDQLDILDYFKGCETSSLEVAKDELSDLDLDLEQLKIMRIKFLSEFGI
jgi:ATP-dependent DNA helicase RecQ